LLHHAHFDMKGGERSFAASASQECARSELTFKQALFRAHLCSVEGSSEPNVVVPFGAADVSF
jgi:hypothetical protein